jgi:sarcosine oxidase subunit beta
MGMKKAYDVVIIGGGIVGCSIAFELAKRGRSDVLVIEQLYLTSGATGRCGAGIRQQWGSALNAKLAMDSIQIFENLEEYTGYDGDCGLKQGGYLLVAFTEKEWEQFHKNLDLQNSLGIKSYAVGLKEIKEIVPHINTGGMLGACYCANDGHADPFHCTFAYAKGAVRQGVEIRTYTKVTGLNVKNGRIHSVITSKGEVTANTVINCAGSNAAGIAAMINEELPIVPERHQILVTEPVAHLMNPMVISFHHNFYVQQTPHGSVIMGIGDSDRMEDPNTNPSWRHLEESAYVVTKTLPVFRNLRVVRQWAGLYDMSPDRNPIIDEAAHSKGFFTVAGFSGHGFMVAPRTAVLVANYLTEQYDSFDIKRFSIDRYRKGEMLLEPSVV